MNTANATSSINEQFEEVNEFEILRPYKTGKLYKFLIDYKMQTMIKLVPYSLKDMKLLNICSGSGMEAQYLTKLGADVTCLDISKDALERAKKRAKLFDFQIEAVHSDAQKLPFEKNSFDFAFVHDGLHHLQYPQKCIAEMFRVAKKGIFFSEPAKALLTRAAVKLGLADDYEDVGNYVYRFSIKELKQWSNVLKADDFKSRRYGMWYSHQPPRWFNLFENSFLFAIFKIFFFTMNAVLGKCGNKLAIYIGKRPN